MTLHEKCQELLQECYGRENWKPVSWQIDPITFKTLLYERRFFSNINSTELFGLPYETVVPYQDVSLVLDTEISSIEIKTCLTLVCMNKVTGRTHYLNDPDNNEVYSDKDPLR